MRDSIQSVRNWILGKCESTTSKSEHDRAWWQRGGITSALKSKDESAAVRWGSDDPRRGEGEAGQLSIAMACSGRRSAEV